MVLRKLSQTLRITLALMVATFSSGLLQPAVAYAVQPVNPGNGGGGNNGTLKIHESTDPSGTESNNPKVCSFNVEGFGFDEEQTGYLVFEVQGGDSPTGTPAGPFNFGPTDEDGFYATEYFDLDDGHYKATLYGKDTGGAINLEDEKAKSKVFKVECEATAEAPTATATLKPCVPNSGQTDNVSVRVFNTNDSTDAPVTYTVVLGGVTKTVTVPDGQDRDVEFGGLTVGTSYSATVTGTDGTVTTNSIVAASCPTIPTSLAPTADVTLVPCTPNSGMNDKVSVRVSNTDDGTNAAVTYTIELGGQNKTVTVPDGENRNVEFGNLTVGTYSATVTGSDGTVTTDSVVVAECPFVSAVPTANALLIPCTPNSGSTDKVSVRVYNTDDGTNAAVTYTIVLGGVTKTVTVPDGENRNVEFGDLTVGTSYSATVTGTDGTVTTNSVTVASCDKQQNICTVSNNNYIAPWMYGGETYPLADEGGTFEFKSDGLYLNTPTVDAYVYGFINAGNTRLSDVDAMSYETLRLVQSAGFEGTLPAYILLVDTNGTTVAGGEKYMFYEPYYNGTVTEGTWQTWDAYDNGDAKWYISGTGQTLRTWDHFVTELPDAVVLAYGFNQGTSNAETFTAIQDMTFDCATTTFGAPGRGGEVPVVPVTPVTPTSGGQVQGTSTTATPVVTAVQNAVLPAVLPSTGGVDSPFMILVASMLAFGATYFLQGKRLLGRREALTA